MLQEKKNTFSLQGQFTIHDFCTQPTTNLCATKTIGKGQEASEDLQKKLFCPFQKYLLIIHFKSIGRPNKPAQSFFGAVWILARFSAMKLIRDWGFPQN